MKTKIAFIFGILLIALIPSGCEESETVLPSYSGNPGELIVVTEGNQWEGRTGKAIREVFQQFQYGLPQKEPYFNVVNTNESDFERVFKTFRNVLLVDIDTSRVTKGKIEYRRNVWAQKQLVIKISAGSVDEFVQLLNDEKDKLIQAFNDMEVNRLYARNKRFGPKKVEKKIAEEYGLKMTLQQNAYIAHLDSQALWIRIEREKPISGYQHQISQGILIYRYPYKALSQFLDTNMFAIRDSVLAAYIEGDALHSHMTTEYKYMPPKTKEINFNGHFGKEIRGLWEMTGEAMGGPMISFFILNEAENEIISAHGYVYAPQFDKREYLREVEAMIRSIELKKPE